MNEDASWLQSIQTKALEQNKICAIKIEKAASAGDNDIAKSYTGFTYITSNEYCSGIAPHRFNASIERFEYPAGLNPVCLSDNDNLYLIFPPTGSVPCGGEILFESEPLRNGNTQTRCINILAPLGLFREGLYIGGSCNYTNAF